MDFERIDINQCPESPGNSGPNRFANTARCKQETTLVCILDKIWKLLIFKSWILKHCTFVFV